MCHCFVILRSIFCSGQGLKKAILVFLAAGIIGCSPKAGIDPPETPLLSRPVLGYGVIVVSYTRVMNEPGGNGVALGIIREKTIVTVLERRLVKEGETQEYWILAEGNYRGWLPDSVIKIYESEEKAQTAALQ